MPDSIPSDHDAVETERVHLSAVGRTGRLQVSLPETVFCRIEDVCSLSIAGTGYYTQVSATLDGDRAFRDAFETRRLARTGDGTDRLNEWFETVGFTADDPLCLDILTEGYAYGLREPGERVVYTPPQEPNRSLAAIAADVTTEE